MESITQHHITSEKDLNFYENYLKNSCPVNSRAYSTSNQIIPVKKQSHEIQVQNANTVMCNRYEQGPSTTVFQKYLSNHIGKIIKVESLIGQCLEARTGILMEVGGDYIVIKLYRGCSSTVIQMSGIKYITIIHDNDLNKTGML